MTATSHATTALHLEDFRRLGVRPHECRLTVIRRAAARSAKALAETQLTAPSDQVGLQLSRVATSAYRLLDPRRRQDLNQRVHVGRILPNALNWAGYTSFCNEQVHPVDESPFGGELPSDGQPIEIVPLDATQSPEAPTLGMELVGLETGGPQPVGWSTGLRDDDLIRISRRGRSGRRRSRSHRPWLLLAVAGLSVGATLGLVTLQYRHNELRLRRIDRVSAEDAASDPRSSIQAATPLPSASEIQDPVVDESPQSEGPVALLQPTSESSHDTAVNSELELAADPITPEPATLDPAATESIAMSSEAIAIGPEEKASSPPEVDAVAAEPDAASLDRRMAGGPDVDSAERGNDGYLLDPFADLATSEKPTSAAEVDSPTEMAVSSEMAAPPETKFLESPVVPGHPVPQDADIRAARKQLVSLVPELAQTVAVKDVLQRVADLEALGGDLEVGTADHWTSKLVIAELAWRVESVAQVRQRLEPLATSYDTSLNRPLSESFVAACQAASLPETHQHLLENGLRLVDQLLMAESYEFARSVVVAIRPSVDLLESESSRVYLDQYTQAIDQTERLAESSRRLVDESGERIDDSGDAGILGRYYCLMLRRWDLGLEWLTEISNPRIASVARQEFELGDDPSADDLSTLSDRWFTVASRSSGHAADSMRLHAMEILDRAKQHASGLKKLEMERQLDEARELLPSFLRPLEPLPVRAATVVPAADARPGDGASGSKNGLSGRITIDGEDIGVQLNYELEVPLTQGVLDTVAERLSRELPRPSIQMVGEFVLEESATVVVSLAETPQDVSQKIQIGGTVLAVDALVNQAEVSLGAGTHDVLWVIEAERLPRVFLRLHDAASGRRLSVVQPNQSDVVGRPTTLTVAMVRGGQ